MSSELTEGQPTRESFFDYGGNFSFRRTTFKRWPYQTEDSICHPVFMSLEWWRSSGDSDVNCVVCQKELEGWEEHDDPFLEHKKHSKQCPVVIAHSFLNVVNAEGNLDSLRSETALKEAYVRWVERINSTQLPRSQENAPVTAVAKGKKKTKKTALKTAMSVQNLMSPENFFSPKAKEIGSKTQRKQPQRQAKVGTLKKGGVYTSVPNLQAYQTIVKKPLPQRNPTVTYVELCSALESIAESVTEKHLVQPLLNRVRAAGCVTNNAK